MCCDLLSSLKTFESNEELIALVGWRLSLDQPWFGIDRFRVLTAGREGQKLLVHGARGGRVVCRVWEYAAGQ